MKKTVIFVIFMLIALMLVACSGESGRTIVIKSNGTYASPQEYPRPSVTTTEKAAETTTPKESSSQVQTAETADGEVYWTEGGGVWHLGRDCSSLSRSKNILSGTVEQALEAGKERVCQRCAG